VSEGCQEFTVDLPLFSGPFRLLADLLLDQKIDVCDVPVARVTESFLERGIGAMSGWDLEEATWFLAVCAVLLELKVGRLLPRPALETEEELIAGVSPDLLYARSLELAAFRKLAGTLSEMMEQAALLVPRTAGPPPELAHLYPDPLEKVTPEALAAVASEVLAPPRDLDLSHVAPIRATLTEALAAVKQHLKVSPKARFRDLVADCPERIDVVMRFLAILELHREGEVELRQASLFGDIEIVAGWKDPGKELDSPGIEVDGHHPRQDASRRLAREQEGRGGG
jgi:segregation and condensation protein A